MNKDKIINIHKEDFSKYRMFHAFTLIFTISLIISLTAHQYGSAIMSGFVIYILYRVIKSYEMPILNPVEIIVGKSKRYHML